MTGTTREKQFKDWLKKVGVQHRLEKINCEGLPDFYAYPPDETESGFFVEVKYDGDGGERPVLSLFSREQMMFIKDNIVLVAYRTDDKPWSLYCYSVSDKAFFYINENHIYKGLLFILKNSFISDFNKRFGGKFVN